MQRDPWAYRRVDKRKALPPWLLFGGVFLATFGIGSAYLQGWIGVAGDSRAVDVPAQFPATMIGAAHIPEGGGERVRFSICHEGGGGNCVVDGDTIWLRGTKIRIADIDAPEIHDFRCPEEKALGDRATERLHELLQGGTLTLGSIGRGDDQFGRKLRIVMVDGASVGEALVGEGLARWYGGGRRSWCGSPAAPSVAGMLD